MRKNKWNCDDHRPARRHQLHRGKQPFRVASACEYVLNQLDDRISLHDRNYRIVGCNRSFADMFGKKPQELVGRHCYELLHGTSEPIDNCPNRETLATNKPCSCTWISPTGTALAIKTTPNRNRNGAITGTVHVVNDITAHLDHKKNYQRQQIELKKNSDLVKELVWKMEQAESAKNQFLSTVSHELRTPLNGVIGLSDLLLDTTLNDEQKNYANIIRNSGDTLLYLIDKIIDFSKMKSGKIAITATEFDLPATIESAADAYAAKAFAKGIEFVCSIDASVPRRLVGDGTRIGQVLHHLIDNAIKFTNHGSVVVHTDSTIDTKENCTVHFSVTDTGIGIPPEQLSKIFSPFSQVDSSYIREYGGMGLGLAIAKNLTELMGGTIQVTSQPGHGTTFSFSLTLLKSNGNHSVVTAPHDTLHLSLLCVGFGVFEEKVLSMYLEETGAAVKTTHNILSAIQCLEEANKQHRHYNGVLINDTLPAEDRMNLMHYGTLHGTNDPLFILVTAAHTLPPHQLSGGLGFADIVIKPIKRRRIHKCIATVFSNGARSMSSPTTETVPTLEKADDTVRVLVAEDNAINSIVITRALEQLGCTVELVANGRDAVTALEHNIYHCVFLDLWMPVMDGISAVRIIRDPASTVIDHAVPIAILSATTTRSEEIRKVEANVDYFLAKPATREQLVEIIGNSIGRYRQTVSALLRKKRLDIKDLMSTLDNNRQLTLSILDMFTSNTAGDLRTIEEAMANGNVSIIKRIIHSIKGASLNIGALELAQEAASAESLHDFTEVSVIEPILNRMKTAFADLTEEITLWSNEFKSGSDHENINR